MATARERPVRACARAGIPGACPCLADAPTRVARVLEADPRAPVASSGRSSSGVVAARPRVYRAVREAAEMPAAVGEGAGRGSWRDPAPRANVSQARLAGCRVHEDLAGVAAEAPNGHGAVARGGVPPFRRAAPHERAAVKVVPEQGVRVRRAQTRAVGVLAPDA